MKIKAKFKGSNSLGYENGENYNLTFKTDSWGGIDVIEIQEITNQYAGTTTLRRDSKCEYTSLKAFLNNWQVF